VFASPALDESSFAHDNLAEKLKNVDWAHTQIFPIPS
jgi:hypothetical protein